MGELPVTLILSDGTEHPEPGKWVFIDRVVDATTATIRARAEFPNPTGVLRPGMFARVRISLPTEEGNILVPERALTELQGKNFVWVVECGQQGFAARGRGGSDSDRLGSGDSERARARRARRRRRCAEAARRRAGAAEDGG